MAIDSNRGVVATATITNSWQQPQPQGLGLASPNESHQRVGGLVVIPDLLRELGIDPTVVLPRAGIEPSALDHVDNRIPYLSLGRIFHECASATGCPHFGFLTYQRARLSHLGIPGELMRCSATFRTGLEQFITFQHLNNQGMATFLLEDKKRASLGCAVYQKDAPFVAQIYDAFLPVACNVMREFLGPQWTPDEVYLSRTKPAGVDVYREFFRAPCKFDRDRTALVFPAPLLDRPMPEANSERLRRVEEKALILRKDELLPRLRQALRTLLISGRSSAQEVAAILSLHRRTLDRRLHDLGTNFQNVLDEIRFETARQLLDNTKLRLIDISASLGYSEPSAFTRAYRRWCGVLPSSRRLANQRSAVCHEKESALAELSDA
jgi:AraC-like DNA-binding protein